MCFSVLLRAGNNARLCRQSQDALAAAAGCLKEPLEEGESEKQQLETTEEPAVAGLGPTVSPPPELVDDATDSSEDEDEEEEQSEKLAAEALPEKLSDHAARPEKYEDEDRSEKLDAGDGCNKAAELERPGKLEADEALSEKVADDERSEKTEDSDGDEKLMEKSAPPAVLTEQQRRRRKRSPAAGGGAPDNRRSWPSDTALRLAPLPPPAPADSETTPQIAAETTGGRDDQLEKLALKLEVTAVDRGETTTPPADTDRKRGKMNTPLIKPILIAARICVCHLQLMTMANSVM